MPRAAVLLTLLTFCACGYQMAGFSAGTSAAQAGNISYYLEEILNKSSNQTITTDMQEYVNRFFSSYGSLRSKEDAIYNMVVALEEYSVTAATISSSRDAVTLNLTAAYSFTITAADGRNLYRETIRRLQSFTPGSSVSEYNSNLEEAFISITDDIMSEFKNDFEISRR